MSAQQCEAALEEGAAAVAYACDHHRTRSSSPGNGNSSSTQLQQQQQQQEEERGRKGFGGGPPRLAICVGELGIGNTTAAAALLAALTGAAPEAVCGRGTGKKGGGL